MLVFGLFMGFPVSKKNDRAKQMSLLYSNSDISLCHLCLYLKIVYFLKKLESLFSIKADLHQKTKGVISQHWVFFVLGENT